MPSQPRSAYDGYDDGYDDDYEDGEPRDPGWSTDETWVVDLWLLRDPALATFVASLCHSAEGRADVAEVIHTFVEDNNPLRGSANLYSDLLQQALRRVKWSAIAAVFLNE